jgi:YHS domain-containing protein
LPYLQSMRTMAQDPICGMEVDETARYTSEFRGVRYFFCSALCKECFDSSPEESGFEQPCHGFDYESETSGRPGTTRPARAQP